MPRTPRTFCLLLALVVSACSASETPMNTNDPAAFGASTDMPATESRYKQNPNPRQRYDVTMTLADAPGAFESINGFMQFDVVNKECLPPPDSNPGGYTSPVPTRSIPFNLEPSPNGGYTGAVFTDGMIDEDYHGRGVCHWELVNVQVQLKATGSESETLFMADFYGKELSAGQSKTIYYWKRRYPQEQGFDDYPESGRIDLGQVPAEKLHEFFSITFSIREATP